MYLFEVDYECIEILEYVVYHSVSNHRRTKSFIHEASIIIYLPEGNQQKIAAFNFIDSIIKKLYMENSLELTTTIALNAWNIHIDRVNKIFDELSDDELAKEVSPGRNTGVYLLGHMAAVHDAMLPLLGLGDPSYPQLVPIFIRTPDKSGVEKPPVNELRKYWKDANGKLAEHFNSMKPEQWLERHTSISEEDFKKEPHRNRLSVLLSRTNHLASHMGQLLFLKN